MPLRKLVSLFLAAGAAGVTMVLSRDLAWYWRAIAGIASGMVAVGCLSLIWIPVELLAGIAARRART